MFCHLCRTHLHRFKLEGRQYWRCAKCAGTLFPFTTLAALPQAKALLAFVTASVKNVIGSKRPCCICAKRMRIAISGGGTTELEACDRCKVVWLDHQEFSKDSRGRTVFGTVRPEEVDVDDEIVPPQSGEAGASVEWLNVDNAMHALTMLPLEEPHRRIRRDLWALLLVLLLCVGLSAGGIRSLVSLGFRPDDPWRFWGLTWISATFIHSGLWHLLTNSYFLWLFGDDVEDVAGAVHFLELLLLSAVGGRLMVLWLAPHSASVLVGASGGIMGLAAYYCLSFPHARVSQFLPLGLVVWRLRLPMAALMGLYVILDLYGARYQIAGHGAEVSHLSHLGGVLVGVLYWFAFPPFGKKS